MLGCFKDNPKTRAEFLTLIREKPWRRRARDSRFRAGWGPEFASADSFWVRNSLQRGRSSVGRSALTIGAAAVCLLLGAAPAAAVDGTVAAGWNVGLGLDVGSRTFDHFTRDLPLSARLGLGYHNADAGRSLRGPQHLHQRQHQRRSPRSSGRGLAAALRPAVPGLQARRRTSCTPWSARAHARLQPPTSTTSAATRTSTSPATPGAWASASRATSPSRRPPTFVLQAGFDWYGKAKLAGHDTAYLPSGDDVNPRNDYDWDDADAAIDQPRWEVVFSMGVRFGL